MTKLCLCFRDNNGAVAGVCTLGWGTRPLHTIQKAFPGLTTKDYFEIGKLCLRDEMPPNSESWFLSRIIRYLRKFYPDKQLLYTWADGTMGKPGYVYQAANFFYGGFIDTEVYVNSSFEKVHPRTFQGLSQVKGNGKMNSRAMTVATAMGYAKLWGRQFRYVYPLCHKQKWAKLQAESPFQWQRHNYPKDGDCLWVLQDGEGRKALSELPTKVTAKYMRPDELTLF